MKKKTLKSTIMTALALGVITPTIVAPIPVEVSAASQEVLFKDIPANHVHFETINDLVRKGIINGYSDGTFRPLQQISRQHAAVLIHRAVDSLPKTKDFVQPKDLPSTHIYYAEIKALMEADLLELDENGNINPTKPLTRGEMAKIIAVAFDLEEKASYDFLDTANDKYAPYIRALYSNGVTTGYEDYTFKSHVSLSRLHYSLFIHRALNIDENFVPEPILPEDIEEVEPTKPNKPTEPSEPSEPVKEDEIEEPVDEKPIEDIELSPDMSLEDFNRTIEHNPLINIEYGDKEVYGWAWENERHRIVLTEGQELLKGTDFKFSHVSAYAAILKPNWENRYNQDFMEAPIIIESYDHRVNITFDHYDKEATELGLKFIEFLHPELYAKHKDELLEIIEEGREALRTDNRRHILKIYEVDGKRLRFGVSDPGYFSNFMFELDATEIK